MQFHLIYQKVHNFCIVDLGGFYLDVIKDRLYTTPAQGEPRRSAQTAMYWIAEAMVRWLAPILSFTAEEIWRYMPGERDESVFHTTWAELPAKARRAHRSTGRRCSTCASAVLRELEQLRVDGRIGAPLDADVDVYCAPDRRAALAVVRRRAAVRVHHLRGARARARSDRPRRRPAGGGDGASAFWISVEPSRAAKCVRCWHKREDVGSDRCASGAVQPLRHERRRCRRDAAIRLDSWQAAGNDV